jgi:uncharacterized membrane protein YsdA (DUF1294 family)/cold shock CspA family protein
MAELGKVEDWHDAKGFGFIAALDGAVPRLFFHIRDYRPHGRRPQSGELVRFDRSMGPDGRPRAAAVRRAAVPVRRTVRPRPHRDLPERIALWPLPAYLAALGWAIHDNRLPSPAAFAAALLGVVTWIAYALDKHAAQQGRRRIPENTLHLLELLGGWPAALIAQRVMRHKTRKPGYRRVFWLAAAAHCAGLAGWIAWP